MNNEIKTSLLGEEVAKDIKNGYIHDLRLGIDLLYSLDENLVGYDDFVKVYDQIKEDTIDAKQEVIKKGLPDLLFQGLEIRLLEFEFKQLLAEKAVQIQHFGGVVPTVN